ncbi:MAG: hypothetical protein WCS73_10075 [Lentisphaeria bacterium]
MENNFSCNPAIHRSFSLARSFGSKTFIQERILAEGLIKDENLELKELFPDYKCGELLRLSFWNVDIKSENELAECDDNNLMGYVIIKKDYATKLSGKLINYFHIFEGVFKKYPHQHNYIPHHSIYKIRICNKIFSILGILYCQQNGLNKCCAHVALRSLITNYSPKLNVAYSSMNKIVRKSRIGKYIPEDGLAINEIEAILNEFKISYKSLNYSKLTNEFPTIRKDLPYQKYLYAGVESGCGSLLAFQIGEPGGECYGRHIVPFWGHTFNKDTWIPNANASYFNIGGGVGYIPSLNWTSSFIGHDDNFGPNFCVPQLYVNPEQVDYVVALQKPKVKYSGIIAETKSLNFLYSIINTKHLNLNNEWINRLIWYSNDKVQKIVFRAVCVEKEKYLSHLKNIKDWNGNKESLKFLKELPEFLPEIVWVVEISLPQLFSANKRKIGEIVLNATEKEDENQAVDYNLFVLARLPLQYIFFNGVSQNNCEFIFKNSKIQSHVTLI